MTKLKVKWLEQILGKEWQITPAGGQTGEAYIARKNGEKLFLKRNSSPFLAVLSAEGIVPKLIWTKRMENGDVITAQHWLNGRELKPDDMNSISVARLLSKIHKSDALLSMLKRIGKEPLLPEHILSEIGERMSEECRKNSVIQQALLFLEKEMAAVQSQDMVVCHCDVNHNNWLLSEREELFLIDWDGAMIADPALDLGMLLSWYIPREEWAGWLQEYGIDLTGSLLERMQWYVISQTILWVIWHNERNQPSEAMNWLRYLSNVLNHDTLR